MIRMGSDYNINKTRFNIANSKGLRNCQRPVDAVMVLYHNDIRQFVKVDPDKGIYSIRSDENARKRTDTDENHIRSPIRRQEDIVAIRVVYHMGIDDSIQVDLYEEHTRVIVIQIKHFVWIGIHIINIISTPTFSIFGNDTDEKSPYIGYSFILTFRRSVLNIAVIISAIHRNHSDRYIYHRTIGKHPYMKRIGHEYKRKENRDQHSSYPGHNHHPLSRNIRYIQFRYHQDYRFLVLFRGDRNDSSVRRGLENSIDGYILYQKRQSYDGIVDERH